MSIIPFGWFRRRKPTTYRVVVNVPEGFSESIGKSIADAIRAYERRGKGAA